jgi:hypothetical protein
VTDSIESDRVALFNAWAAFRQRIGRQRSKGHAASIRQSLMPLLSEMLEEVTRGFKVPDRAELPHLRAEVRFGRVGIWVSRTAERKGEREETPGRKDREELPVQPLFRDAGGVRFVANEFVRWMLDEGKRKGVFTLDSLARLGYPDDHFAQLLMLIGYSISGFQTHTMVPDDVWPRVEAEIAKLPPPRSEGA